jgi:hypothetical protein
MQLVAYGTVPSKVPSFEKKFAKINKSRLDEYQLLAPSYMSRFGILNPPSGSQSFEATVRSTQVVLYSIALFKAPWHHWHCHEYSNAHQAALAWHSNVHSANGRTDCISICVAFRASWQELHISGVNNLYSANCLYDSREASSIYTLVRTHDYEKKSYL